MTISVRDEQMRLARMEALEDWYEKHDIYGPTWKVRKKKRDKGKAPTSERSNPDVDPMTGERVTPMEF